MKRRRKQTSAAPDAADPNVFLVEWLRESGVLCYVDGKYAVCYTRRDTPNADGRHACDVFARARVMDWHSTGDDTRVTQLNKAIIYHDGNLEYPSAPLRPDIAVSFLKESAADITKRGEHRQTDATERRTKPTNALAAALRKLAYGPYLCGVRLVEIIDELPADRAPRVRRWWNQRYQEYVDGLVDLRRLRGPEVHRKVWLRTFQQQLDWYTGHLEDDTVPALYPPGSAEILATFRSYAHNVLKTRCVEEQRMHLSVGPDKGPGSKIRAKLRETQAAWDAHKKAIVKSVLAGETDRKHLYVERRQELVQDTR